MNHNAHIRHERTPKGIQAALNALAAAKPALSSLVSLFGPVLVAKAELTQDLPDIEITEPDVSDPDWVRFSKGVPLFALTGLMDFRQELKQAAHAALPPLAEAYENIRWDIETIQSRIADDSLDAEQCVQAYVGNFTQIINALAARTGTRPDVFMFAMAQLAQPFKQLQARAFAPLLQARPWPHGHCPMCGAFPAVSALTGEDERWLHCPVCTHEWRFRLHTCPRCENNDQNSLEYLSDPNASVPGQEHVEVCKVCNTYILGLDLCGQTDPVNMDVAAMGMFELDIQAREKGFSPQAEMLWTSMA